MRDGKDAGSGEPATPPQHAHNSSPTSTHHDRRTRVPEMQCAPFDGAHPLSMRGFTGFEEFIRSQGGIVSRRELLAAGWTADELRIARGCYRRPLRLRRGWYHSSDVPDIVRRAWAHGGPLACVSALRWYASIGTVDGEASQGAYSAIGDTLHVCLPRHAKRRRVEAHPVSPLVIHCHDAANDRRSRWAVPLAVALEQARWCATP